MPTQGLSDSENAVALFEQATADNWVSCGSNDECVPREKNIPKMASFHKVILDMNWEIKDVMVDGNTVIVRGEATGTPSVDFFGVPHSGKSFRIMSIDVHTIENGKIIRSYQIENWLGATAQLRAQ